MRVLLDTSVLTAAIVEGHPEYQRARPGLRSINSGADEGVVSSHSRAELYSNLTAMPIRPRLRPHDVRRTIKQDVLGVCEVVALDRDDYVAVIDGLSARGLIGGVTYDALLLIGGVK